MQLCTHLLSILKRIDGVVERSGCGEELAKLNEAEVLCGKSLEHEPPWIRWATPAKVMLGATRTVRCLSS